MTRRRPTRGAAQIFGGPAEDKLTRLIRMIARAAAQEALKAFAHLQTQQEVGNEEVSEEIRRSTGSGERFFSVAEIAVQLEVSEKSIRRKVAEGELTAIKVGKLLRIGQRSVAAYLARARLGNGAEE
jgi:excisionase family DNA binding protein